MYITEIDLGGHGECAECNLGTYRIEKSFKNQPKFMKMITIRIPIQMDIEMSCSENHWKYSQLWQHFSSRNISKFSMRNFFTLFWVRGLRYNTSHRCGSHQSAPSILFGFFNAVRFFKMKCPLAVSNLKIGLMYNVIILCGHLARIGTLYCSPEFPSHLVTEVAKSVRGLSKVPRVV